MQLYPAIDMKNGKCVRLRQGAFKDITVYSEHPEEIAALLLNQPATDITGFFVEVHTYLYQFAVVDGITFTFKLR